jgi:hypothetical protein
MKNYIELSEIDRAAEIIRAQISVRPRVGMILGSGEKFHLGRYLQLKVTKVSWSLGRCRVRMCL